MTTATRRLADVYAGLNETIVLFDAPTGQRIDDDPADYAVLAEHIHGGYTCRAVQGPSGAIDVEGPHAGCLNRNVLAWPEELPLWLNEAYPG